MNEKINILNIELYQTSAKAAMQKVVQYMESDSINTVEIITMDMLLKGKDMPGWKEAVESLNLVLPGETEILEAAGVREKTLLRDTAGLVFLKMFLRYIQRNKKRVFLVAQSETELLEMESAIREHDRKLILAGRGVLPPDGAGIEQVINAVNGAETDCIFSLLPSPEQELLIQRNSALLNARVWFGCGSGGIFPGKENCWKSRKKERFKDFCAGKCSVTRWDGSREVKNKKASVCILCIAVSI